jgi:hypothetical protein
MTLEAILDSDDFPEEDELMEIIMHTAAAVWKHELGKKHIDAWLANFKGEVFDVKYEKLMALWLLSHFTFYNQSEVERLCKVVYQDLLHLIITSPANAGKSPSQIINDFFVSANIIPSEAVSGSGGFVAYLFRHINNLPVHLFNYSITNVSDKVENLITIDDVTLSPGPKGQIAIFLKKHKDRFKSRNVYLLTLLATQAAVHYLTKTFNVQVVTAIQLDARDKCFSDKSDIFSSFPELIGPFRKFAEHYGKKIFSHPLGFEDGQYTFGFYYNAPDNTLPIFWSQMGGWAPVIKRHHKNYTSRRFLQDERFI